MGCGRRGRRWRRRACRCGSRRRRGGRMWRCSRRRRCGRCLGCSRWRRGRRCRVRSGRRCLRRFLRWLLRFSVRAQFWLGLRDHERRRALRMRCGACELHRSQSRGGKQHEAKIGHVVKFPGRFFDEVKSGDERLRVRPDCGRQRHCVAIYFCMQIMSRKQRSLRIQMQVAIASHVTLRRIGIRRGIRCERTVRSA